MTAGRRYFSPSDARGDTPRRFRRRPENSFILGVCAGVADYFSLDRTIVRLAALLLLWVFTVPSMLAYLLLAWLGETR